jgi:hypothetical protein
MGGALAEELGEVLGLQGGCPRVDMIFGHRFDLDIF